ncbi:MAG: DUF1896 family protein [Empedobacter falsenii]
MDVKQKDLSYFRLRLQELLNSSFPEKAHDPKFIDQRSSWTANAYEGAFRSFSSTFGNTDVSSSLFFQLISLSIKPQVIYHLLF